MGLDKKKEKILAYLFSCGHLFAHVPPQSKNLRFTRERLRNKSCVLA